MDTWVSYQIFKNKIQNNEVVCSYMPNLQNCTICCLKLNPNDKDYNNKNYTKRRCKLHEGRTGIIKKYIKNDPPLLDKPNGHIRKEPIVYNYIHGVVLHPPKIKKSTNNSSVNNSASSSNVTSTSTISIPSRRVIRPPRPPRPPQNSQNSLLNNFMSLLDVVTGDNVFSQLNRADTYYDIPLTNIPAAFFEPVQIQRDIPISNVESISVNTTAGNTSVENTSVENTKENKVTTENNCVICMENSPIYVTVPCGHIILCDSCVKSGSHNQLQGKCPTCRSDVQTIVKIFK